MAGHLVGFPFGTKLEVRRQRQRVPATRATVFIDVEPRQRLVLVVVRPAEERRVLYSSWGAVGKFGAESRVPPDFRNPKGTLDGCSHTSNAVAYSGAVAHAPQPYQISFHWAAVNSWDTQVA